MNSMKLKELNTLQDAIDFLLEYGYEKELAEVLSEEKELGQTLPYEFSADDLALPDFPSNG